MIVVVGDIIVHHSYRYQDICWDILPPQKIYNYDELWWTMVMYHSIIVYPKIWPSQTPWTPAWVGGWKNPSKRWVIRRVIGSSFAPESIKKDEHLWCPLAQATDETKRTASLMSFLSMHQYFYLFTVASVWLGFCRWFLPSLWFRTTSSCRTGMARALQYMGSVHSITGSVRSFFLFTACIWSKI